MSNTKEYWMWWWGVESNNYKSTPKRFDSFSVMKDYSAKHHVKNASLIPNGYYSNYEKFEQAPIKTNDTVIATAKKLAIKNNKTFEKSYFGKLKLNQDKNELQKS